MIFLLIISLLSAFVALVLASQLPAPAWMRALDGLAVSLSVATMSALNIVSSKLSFPTSWKPFVFPAFAAIVAVVCRKWLIEWLSPPEPIPQIDYQMLQLAALSVTGAIFALFSGIVLMNSAKAWFHLLFSGASITVSLFVLGPLLIRAGFPVDHRAFLGLAGLGAGAYIIVEAARRMGK